MLLAIAETMKNYGPPILTNGLFDHFGRVKNRAITRRQYRLLDLFGSLPDSPAQWFARLARRLVGGYLYSLKVEVNEICTLRCKMCYVPQGPNALGFETVRSLLDQLRGCGVRLELLGGEPLMHPAIVDMVAYAKRKAQLPFVSLYTNGLDATPEMAARLYAAGLDAAVVSLISHRAAVHDEFTGAAGSWQQTSEGIRNLLRAGVAVYTFTALHQYNHEDYRLIYTFVRDQLKAHALFYQYIPQVKDDPLRIDPKQWHQIKHWMLAERSPEHMHFVRKFLMLTGNACAGGNFVLTVKADGSVQPCPFISDLSLGSIHEKDIWTIFRNRFRGSPLRELKGLPEECKDCSYRSVCGGGCRAGNRVLFGSYGVRDYRCLGPWTEPIQREQVTDCVPCFF